MNKIQKRELVRAKRLQQTKNRELNRAIDMVQEANSKTPTELAEICKATSNRVLEYLTKDDVDLLEGLTITNPVRDAAKNEVLERSLLSKA